MVDALAGLFPRQRAGAVVLPQELVAADCQPEQFLHPRELSRYQTFRLHKRRREFLAGRVCAKLALRVYQPELPIPPELLEIASDPSGRPLLSLPEIGGIDDLHLSITHGGELAGAVLAEAPCGIDLQPIKDNLLKVREKYCRPEEEQLLENILKNFGEKERLVLLWTAKEAMKKALSHRRMCGFLELRLENLRPLAGCFVLRLAGPREVAASCQVISAFLGEYGLAICLAEEN